MRVANRVTTRNPMVTPDLITRCSVTDRKGFEPLKRLHVYTLSRRGHRKLSLYKERESSGLAAHAVFVSGEVSVPKRKLWRNHGVTTKAGRPGPFAKAFSRRVSRQLAVAALLLLTLWGGGRVGESLPAGWSNPYYTITVESYGPRYHFVWGEDDAPAAEVGE